MTGEREDIVRYRMERARETLVEADAMAAIGHWNACVNRLYYACFYSATALLLRYELSSSKHSGVRSLFNRHFGRSGTISRELVRLYNDLFENRQEGDYEDFVRFEESQVRPWLGQARRFVERIEELLASPAGGRPDG